MLDCKIGKTTLTANSRDIDIWRYRILLFTA